MNQQLVNAQGIPIHTNSKIVVLKYPPGTQVPQQLVQLISKATGCSIIVLPMDAELMMGRVALDGIISTHVGIHAVLNIAPDFTEDEYTILSSALKYVCEQTQPGDDSKEVALLKKLNLPNTNKSSA